MRPNTTPDATSATENDDSDERDTFRVCPVCGNPLTWIECWECGGEGEFDWETLQDEDPLWYGPDDTEQCSTCRGKGGWWECFNAEAHQKANAQ